MAGPISPIAPISPIQPIHPFEPTQTGAPNVRGPRIPGTNSPKLGGRNRPGLGLLPKFPQFPQLQGLKLPSVGGNLLSLPTPGTQGIIAKPMDLNSQAMEQPPAVDHKSVNGWVKNFAEDVHGFIAAIPASFKIAIESGIEIVQNAEWLPDLLDNPALLSRELDATMGQVIHGFLDHYKDGIGEALYKHPFSTILDLAGATGLTASGVRVSARAAFRMGRKVEAARMMKLAESIDRLPGKLMMTPPKLLIEGIRRTPKIGPALERMTMGIGRRMGLTPIGIEAKNLFGTYRLEGQAKASADMKRLLTHNLKKVDFDEFNDLVDGFKPLAQASSPTLRARAQEWIRQVAEHEDFLQQWGLKTGEALDDARVKALAAKLHQRDIYRGNLQGLDEKGNVVFTREALDFSKRYAAGENQWRVATTPTYRPFLHERSLDPADLWAAINKGDDLEFLQFVGRLEKRTGLQSGVLDPDTWMARGVLQIEDMRSTMRFMSDAVQKWSIPVRGNVAPAGYKILNPILERYVKDGIITGYERLLDNAVDAVRKAPEGQKVKALQQAITKTQDDLMGRQVWQQALIEAEDASKWQIAIPDEVALVLQANLGATNPITRFYDRVLNTWRTTVLTLMPRFYVNNIIGNGVLLMFGGVNPFTKSMAMRPSFLPGEVAATGATLAAEGSASSSFLWNRIPKRMRFAFEALQEVTDIRPRQVLLQKELRQILERDKILGDTVAMQLTAEKSIDEAMEVVLQARKELLSLGEKRQILAREATQGGEFGKFAARVDPSRPRLSRADEAQIAGMDRELRALERKVRTERSLSNFSRENSSRVRDLQAQIQQLAARRRRLAPDRPLLRAGDDAKNFPTIKKLQDVMDRQDFLRPIAAKVEEAVRSVETFLGNYGRLHPLERTFIRRVIPFWIFSKSMARLIFQLPFVAPKVSFLWHHYAKFIMDGFDDDRLPLRFRKMVALPWGSDEDGNIVFIRIGGSNPFDSASLNRSFNFGGVQVPGFMDLASNPIIKMIIESRGGFDTFTERAAVTPEQYLSLWGAVYEYDPDMKRIERVLPSKNLKDSLLQQIPHIKLVAELIDSLGARKAGAFLGARTPQNPDGTYRYDRSWWYALSRSMGFSVSVTDPQRVIRQQEIIKGQMIRRYASAARRLPPDQREEILHLLRDMQNGGVTFWEP